MAETPDHKVDEDNVTRDEATEDAATMMEAEFQIHQSKRKRKKEIRRTEGTKDSSDEEELTAKDSKKACAGTAAAPVVRRDHGMEAEKDLPAELPGPKSDTVDNAGQGHRIRLLFHSKCSLSFDEKLLWAAKLARKHKSFEALLKTGRNTTYVTVGSTEAVETLTTTGFEDIVLQKPDTGDGVKRTKVIIFGFSKVLDPDFLLDDGRFEWVKRNSVRGEERNQLVAMVKGEVMSRVFIPGIGYRKVGIFVPYPIMCMKCSRWNHKAWSCQYDERCRFCARGHPSSVCNAQIKAGEKVVPRCCNCRGSHNANYSQCPARPIVSQPVQNNVPPAIRYVSAPPPKENAWQPRAAASEWPGLGERAGAAVPLPAAPAAPPTASNADIMAVLVDLKKSFQQLSERVGKLEKGLEKVAKESSETNVCLSAREHVQKERPEAVTPNECVDCISNDDIEFMEGDEVEEEGDQGEVEISRKFILDMCQEMKQVAEQLMTRVTTDNIVKLSRGSVSHALVKVLGDAKYK